MGLKIMPDGKGGWRKTWHGRVSVKGTKRTTNLNVPIAGTIPVDELGNVDLSRQGDEKFEQSRKAAQKAFDAWRKETQKDPAEMVRKAYKARTGEDLEGLPLSKLYANWQSVSRGKDPTPGWCAMIKGWFDDFAAFAQAEARKHGKRCETANDVTPEIATAWFNHVKAAYTWETVLKMKHLISGTFTRLQGLGLSRINPFSNMQLRGGGNGGNKKVSRKALTEAETERMLDLARGTDIYPLVVTAVCTGMRISDICNLQWGDVDLNAGLIDCVTAKAGVRVTIPILGRLSSVLNECAPIPGDGTPASPYVFPAAQSQYKRNKHRIVQAVKPLFARAVFGDKEPAADAIENSKPQRELADVIGGAGFTEYKRNRLMDIYARIKAGERSVDIAAALNIARSQVSMDLREIEKITGQTLRPMAVKSAQRKTRLDLIEQTRQARGIGKRQASVYGWHSFRHGFVIFALKAGVPVEDVRRIVGHGEAETTLENYYNPEREHAAERVRKQLSGTVLGGETRKRIGVTIDAPADGCAVARAGKADAGRLLAVARAVLSPDEAAKADAVIAAAGVNPDSEPERALALIAATVDGETQRRIAAVVKAAGI